MDKKMVFLLFFVFFICSSSVYASNLNSSGVELDTTGEYLVYDNQSEDYFSQDLNASTVELDTSEEQLLYDNQSGDSCVQKLDTEESLSDLKFYDEDVEYVDLSDFSTSDVALDMNSSLSDIYFSNIKINSVLLDNSRYDVEIGFNSITNESFLIVSESAISTSSSINTVLNGSSFVMYYKNGKYSVSLTDIYGNPLSDKSIVFTVNGVGYVRKTNSNGVASLNINLNPDTYSISALFAGDDSYNSATVNNTIYVMSTIYGSNLVKSFRNDSQFYVVLYDGEGMRLKNSYALFNINGVIYNRSTDYNGISKLNINLDPGKYIITVTNGNDGLLWSYNITVVSHKVNFDCGDFTINRKGESYKVKLVDDEGNVLANKTVNIVVNGVSYSRVTNSNGIASLRINYGTGNYNVYCTFAGEIGYNSFASSTKTIKMLSSSTLLDVSLNTEDVTFNEKGDKFEAVLKDNNGYAMVNQTVVFTVNGVSYNRISDSDGVARLTINLNEGSYSITSYFAGSSYYKSVQKENIINMNFTPNFYYSVEIPLYYNVSGLDYVSDSYALSDQYVAKAGANGIVKVYKTGLFHINNSGILNGFAYGELSYLFTPNYTALSEGDAYFVSKNGLKTSVDSDYVPSQQGIMIKVERDFIKFYYYDVLSKDEINQFSAFYSLNPLSNLSIHSINFVKNFNQWGMIILMEPVITGDGGLKLQLNKGNLYYNGVGLGSVSYNQLLSNLSSLSFTSTGESLTFDENCSIINNTPYLDFYNTVLKVEDNEIVKKENISSSIIYDFFANFNTMQTYTIVDRKVSLDDVVYWLNQELPSSGPQKAVYGTFLNGLLTISMSDNLANEKDDFYNVSWNREDYTIAMSGINYGGMSYIHIPDPSMGMVVEGDDEDNVKNFRLECSILLSDIENIIMGSANLNSSSSLSAFLEHINDGEWFRLENQSGMLVWRLMNFSEKIMINQSSGVIAVTSEIDGFSYKGAVSSSYNYCYHDGLTDNLLNSALNLGGLGISGYSQVEIINGLDDSNNDFLGLSNDEWNFIEGTLGGLFIDMSVVAIKLMVPFILSGLGSFIAPEVIGVAVGFSIAGIILTAESNDVFTDFNGNNWNKAKRDISLNYLSSISEVPIY